MVLQCSKLFYYKVSGDFLRQNSQSSYSFAKIQNVGETKSSEEKNSASLEKDFIFYFHIYFFACFASYFLISYIHIIYIYIYIDIDIDIYSHMCIYSLVLLYMVTSEINKWSILCKNIPKTHKRLYDVWGRPAIQNFATTVYLKWLFEDLHWNEVMVS